MKKKIFFIVILLLLVIEIGIFSISNLYITKVEKVEKQNDGKMFALMVEQNKGAGDYEEVEDEEWPKNNYKFNKEKSYCEDVDGNKIVTTGYDLIDYKGNNAIVKTTKTVYCYLYFDVKTSIDFTFYLGGESNPKYTTSKNIDLYIKTDDSDADKYCISKTNNTTGCTWKNMSELNYTLDSTNGTQTYYVFLKSKDGTITENSKSDEIILDDVKPSCSFEIDSNNIVFKYSDNLPFDNGNTKGSENKGALTARTYYGSITDAAGNSCSTNKTISAWISGSTSCKIYRYSCSSMGDGIWYYNKVGRPGATVSSCNGYATSPQQLDITLCYSSGPWGFDQKVCECSTTTSYCSDPYGTQIPGTNYCW